MDLERIEWLKDLINAYSNEHRWSLDPDPSATHEMLANCRALYDELKRKAEQPAVEVLEMPLYDPDVPF